MPYNCAVIRLFRSKGLRRFAERSDPSRLSVQNADRIRRILLALNAAKSPEAMNVPVCASMLSRATIAADTRSMQAGTGE
jgi:plasmid maintenance system killer protein